MTAVLSWLTGKIVAPAAAILAVLFALGFAWQTVAIDGWPIFGGGYKAQVATLKAQVAQDATDRVTFQIAAQTALKQRDDAIRASQDKIAAAYQDGLTHSPSTTIIQKVPTYVSAKSDAACIVPWGAVRLFDAAASGSDPGAVSAAIAPGQPDDGPSGIPLSRLIAVLAENFGAGRDNANQLSALQAAIRAAQ